MNKQRVTSGIHSLAAPVILRVYSLTKCTFVRYTNRLGGIRPSYNHRKDGCPGPTAPSTRFNQRA